MEQDEFVASASDCYLMSINTFQTSFACVPLQQLILQNPFIQPIADK